MTLVATLKVRKYPILLGDILISSETKPENMISMPTIGDCSSPYLAKGHYLTGLTRKVHIVNSNLAVGWSGLKISARTIIRNMVEYFKDEKITLERIEEYFSNYDGKEKYDVSIIGVLIDERRQFKRFDWRASKHFFSKDNPSYIAGSGCVHFIEFAERNHHLLEESSGSSDPLREALERTLLNW